MAKQTGKYSEITTYIDDEKKDDLKQSNIDDIRSVNYVYDREFLIGIGMFYDSNNKSISYDDKRINYEVYGFLLDCDYEMNKYIRLNKNVKHFQFIFEKRMSLLNNNKESSVLTGIQFIDDQENKLLVGNIPKNNRLEYSIENIPCFGMIKYQSYWVTTSNSGWTDYIYCYEGGINYIELYGTDNKLITKMGIKEDELMNEKKKFNKTDFTVHAKTSKLIGCKGNNIYIIGLVRSNKNILGIQFCDLMDDGDIIYAYQMSKHLSISSNDSYKSNNVRIHELPKWSHDPKVTKKNLDPKRYLFESMICVIDNEIIDMFNLFVGYCVNIDDCRIDLKEIYEEITQMCVEGDISKIHSIMSLQRYLNYCIQQNDTTLLNNENSLLSEKFRSLFNKDTQYKYLIKIQKCWNIAYEIAKFGKNIHYYQASFNAFTVTYLDDSINNKVASLFSFIGQMSLTVLLIYGIINSYNENDDSSDENEGIDATYVSMAVIMGIIILYLVKVQISSHASFCKVFGLKYMGLHKDALSIYVLLSFLVNCVVAVFLIFISIIIMMNSSDQIEFVLNSIAVLFVLELDDQIIEVSDDETESMYFNYIINNYIITGLNNINPHYFEFSEKWHYYFNLNINKATYEIDWNNNYNIECLNIVNTSNNPSILFVERLEAGVDVMIPNTRVPVNTKCIKFRLVSECYGCRFHFKLHYQDNRKDTHFEYHMGNMSLRLRYKNESNKIIKQSKERVLLPVNGSWFCIKWMNTNDGNIALYTNNTDINPEINNKNTKCIHDCPYKDICPTLDDIKYISLYSYKTPVKIAFYK